MPRDPWAECTRPPSASPAPLRVLGPERKGSAHLPLDSSAPRSKGPPGSRVGKPEGPHSSGSRAQLAKQIVLKRLIF